MTWEVNLWNHLYITHFRILYNLAHIGLSVVATPPLVSLAIARPDRAITTPETTLLGQLRVRLYLYSPRLVIRQVQA